MNSEDLSGLKCPYCKLARAGIRYDFNEAAIVRCSSCELMWLYPMPALDQLSEVYDKEYFSNKAFLRHNESSEIWGYTDYIAERINKQYQYQKLVRGAKSMLMKQRGAADAPGGGSWLDVGCGLGYLLDVAFDAGFSVSGVEFNRSAVDYIRSKYAYDVKHGDITNIPFEKSYDVVSAIDVIEHLRNPFEAVEKMRRIIKDDGLLILGTMDSDSRVSRFFGKRLEDFRRIREHLFFFSRKTLTRVLEDYGFEVLSVEYVGHTFQVGALLDRIDLMLPGLGRCLKLLVRPAWLLEANFYLNPRTKILVLAKPKEMRMGLRSAA